MEPYESHRHRMIISADDFGISPRANENILYLASLGKIDRVGVMSDGKISQAEVEELIRSGVKLDIHLDILHEIHDQRSNRQGAASRVLDFLWKLTTGKISPKKVSLQWQEQIEQFIILFGKSPDGINSHEHVHFFPPYFKIAIQLRNQFDIPYMRMGDSIELRHHTAVAHILHFLRLVDRRICKKDACISSGSLVSLDWIDDLEKFMTSPPDGTIEIACHPELAGDFAKIKKYF